MTYWEKTFSQMEKKNQNVWKWSGFKVKTILLYCFEFVWSQCFPGGSNNKESARNAGDLGLILGSGGSLEEGNDNPILYSCLENPMDRGAWRAMVSHRVRHDWSTFTSSAQIDKKQKYTVQLSPLLNLSY